MSDPADPRALDALRRDREADPPDGARDRVASKLGLMLPLSAPTSGGASHGSAAGHAATSGACTIMGHGALAGTRLLVLLGAVFVAGAGVGALLHAELARPLAPQRVYMQ
ncbi:MAG TPA: hypothetical protein VH044_03840, partial [Polyangiaceae bacterium]|nr:hypothetical protein [Polyangiaceae bacterium]